MPKIVDPEERRAHVAQAVFRVIVRDGLEYATLRNVAEEAGLAIGSVRHYFAGHDELMLFAVRALADTTGRRLEAHVQRLVGAGTSADVLEPDPAERRAASEAMLAEFLPLDDARHAETVVWLEFATASRTRPDLRGDVYTVYDGMRRVIVRILEGARRTGSLAPDLDLETAADGVLSMVNGLAVDMVLHPDRLTAQDAMRVLRRHLAELRGG